MNHTGALGGFPTALVSPRVHLNFAGGDEGFQIKELVCCLDQAVDAALLEAYVFQELLSLFVSLKFGDVGLGLCGHNQDFCTFRRYGFAHTLHMFVARHGRSFVDVADIEHRLGG